MMGKSRSTSFVIAYLMKYMAMNFESAYKLVKSSRKCAFPNLGFIRQLREFGKLSINENEFK
jgi:protein-tyrosine phosphatase